MPMTIPSDLEIIFSHNHRRQIIADTVPPIKGQLFHEDVPGSDHSPDAPSLPLPIDQLLQDSIAPVNVVYGFKIRF